MKMFGKFKLLLMGLFTLGAIGAAAISTFAWFTINQPPLTNEMISGSASLTIDNDNVTGYKIEPVLGANGFTDYSNTTVTARSGSTISTENHDQDQADLNFDVPELGIGYYLIKQNDSGSFKYKHDGVSMSSKFTEIDNNDTNYAYIGSFTVVEGDVLRVKHYTFENYKTVNKQIGITSVTGDTSVAEAVEKDVTIKEGKGGTYKVWLDKNAKTLSFETVPSFVNSTAMSTKAANKTRPSPKRSTISTSSSKAYILVPKTLWASTSNFSLHYSPDYSNTDQNHYNEVKAGTNMHAMSDDGGDYWYYEIDATVKDIWIKFYSEDGGNKWMAAHNASTHQSFSAGTVYKVSSFVIIENSSQNYVKFSGWGEIKTWWDGAENNPGILGMTFQDAAYSLPASAKKTYYLDDNPQKVFSNGTVYAYAYDSGTTIWPRNNVWPGDQMTKIRDYFYSIEISTSYTKLIFNNSDNIQSPDGSHGAHTAPTGTNNALRITGVNSSTPYNAGDMGTSYTYYLYDPEEILGSQPYVHYWNNSTPYATTGTSNTSLLKLTSDKSDHDGLWHFSISQRFTHFLFADRQNISAGDAVKTDDIAVSSGNHNKYYWLYKSYNASTNTSSFDSGNFGVFTSLPETTTRCYYLFDNNGKLGDPEDTLYAYAWSDTYKEKYTEGGTLAQWRNAVWPGVEMTKDPSSTYGWFIEVSTSYDRIIFNNGGSNSVAGNQTSDLTVDPSEEAEGSANVGADGWHFVLSGSTIPSGIDYGKWAGSWVNETYSVDLRYSFFTRPTSGGAMTSLNAYADIHSEDSYGIEPFYPQNAGADSTYYGNSSTGAYFYMTKADAGDVTWYTDVACTQPFTQSVVATDKALYRKMVATLADHTTFYVDVQKPSWDSVHVYYNDNYTDVFETTACVASGLYRLTFPSSWTFRLGNSDHSKITTASIDPDGSSATKYLHVSSGNVATWASDRSASIGTATIHVLNSSLTEIATYSMELGDCSNSNYFIYEHGFRAPVGSSFYVSYDAGSSGNPYSLASYYTGDEYIDSLPIYLSKTAKSKTLGGNSKHLITTQNYSNNARFNVYLNMSKKISVVMVPDFGNGFYIMDYNSSYGADNFIDATKMNTHSTTQATYAAYYASAGKQIFIRSYMDAVDTHITTLGSHPSGVSMSDGVITFDNPGYFNIFVDNGTVAIDEYSPSDFFKLNPLEFTKKSSRSEIKSQKTSLILEIPFTTDNLPCSISVKADGLHPFVGIALYVSSSKVSNPYDTLRALDGGAFYNSLSNGTATDYAGTTVSANTTYYAYILIDYLPTSGDNYSTFSNGGSMYFYLKSDQ